MSRYAKRGQALRGILLAVAIVAVLAAGAWVLRAPPSGEPAPTGGDLRDGLVAEDPLRRAAACRVASPAALLARAGDKDWRVRAASFAALDDRAPLGETLLRDTPMAQRERVILAWGNRHEPGLVAQLCEIYADARHVEFGETLAAECLACHVGPVPPPERAGDRCASCHPDVHAAWAGSAHAQSLTHLRLPTVDPVSRQPGFFDFTPLAGAQRGMSCVACHEADGAHATCVATFRTTACASCHAEVQTQWEAWQTGPQPRRATWPPGSVELGGGTDARDCVGCHMPRGESDTAKRDHRWLARRSVELLRDGLIVDVRRGAAGAPEIALTNLAGHDYPTGSTRRALEIRVTLDDGEETLLASLSPARLDTAPLASAPALGPGEARVFAMAGAPDGEAAGGAFALPSSRTRVRCHIVYVRNRFDPESYRIEIFAIERELPPPPTPPA